MRYQIWVLKEKQILLTKGPFFQTLKSLLAEKKDGGDFFLPFACCDLLIHLLSHPTVPLLDSLPMTSHET